MTYIEIGMIVILALCCIIGLVSGLIKGWLKGLVRCFTVAIAIVCAFLLRQTLTDLICFKIQVNGGSIYELICHYIEQAASSAASSYGIDIAQIITTVWPLIEIIISVLVFFLSLIIFVLLSNVIYGVLYIFLHSLKSKLRIVGGLIGVLTGGVVGLCLCSVVSGVAANASSVLNLSIGGESIKTVLNIDENSDLWKKIGLEEYKESGLYKPMSYVDKVVFDKISAVNYEGKTYTLVGQLSALNKSANLTNSLLIVNSIDLQDTASVEELADSLSQLDFKDLSPEEKEFVNDIISEIIPEEYGIVITADDLANVDFTYLGDSIETVSKMANGEEVSQSEVNTVVENLAKSGALEVTSEFHVEINSYIDEETKEVLQIAVDNLTVSDTSGISEEDISQLKDLFGLK